MSRTKLCKLILFLIYALSFTSTPSLFAHGPIEGDLLEKIETHRGKKAPEGFELLPNARIFAWRFSQQGKYLLSKENLEHLKYIHSLMEYADYMAADQTQDHDQEYIIYLQYEAQRLLLELLDTLPCTLTVKTTDEYLSFDSENKIPLSGNSGFVILKVIDGKEPVWMETLPYTLTEYDLEPLPEPAPKPVIEYKPGGVSYIMYRVYNASKDPVVIDFNLLDMDTRQIEGQMFARFIPEPQGSLKVRITDKEGQEIPAMVRLTHVPTGTYHRPSSAIEFSPQMHNIAGEPVPSRGFDTPALNAPTPYWIPGEWWGHYWCVPDQFHQSLPAGDWKIHVWKGPEYIPLEKDFKIMEGELTEFAINLDRWIDMPSKGWHSGDVHIHSRLMSDDDAERLHLWLDAADISVANVVKMGNYLRTYFEQRGYGKEYRVEENNRVLVPGQEDPRFAHGHTLGINASRFVRDTSRYFFTEWVADEIHKAGGMYGHAHMTFNGFNVRRDVTTLLPQGKSDFGEVMQIGKLETELYFDFLNLGYSLTAAAGSDVPFSHGLGEVRLYAYTGSEQLNTDDWFAAMKKGHTFVSNGPMVDFTVNGELPGTHLVFDEPETLDVKLKAYSYPYAGSGLKSIRIWKHGEIIKEIEADSLDEKELSLELSLPLEYGFWVAAEAINNDDTRAFTTPVYVQRRGFRFWKFDKVKELIEVCRNTIDDWEMECKLFMEENPPGSIPDYHHYKKMLSEQIPAKLEEFKRTRTLYDDLEAVYLKEIELRK